MENLEKKLYVKCPMDDKLILISQCYKCNELFQIQYSKGQAYVECRRGKSISVRQNEIENQT